MLVTNQVKQTGDGFAVTGQFLDLVNLNEAETGFAFLSTEEIGPPVDPNLTAPVIYGSQSQTFGSRTVLMGSTSQPGTYTVAANSGYRFDPTDVKGYKLVAAGGETLDLGELRNRTSGTQSIRLYGNIAPYSLSYIRVSAPFFHKVFIFPNLGVYSVDSITNIPSERVVFTDNWGGKGYATVLSPGEITLRRPNNSFPNVAQYSFTSTSTTSQGVQVHTYEFIEGPFGPAARNFVCVSAGDFKITGLLPTTFIEENAAITQYNTTYSTSYPTLDINDSSNYGYTVMGGTVSSVTTAP